MKWRVELTWSSNSSLGAMPKVEYKIIADGVASNKPVGSPWASRWIWPPGGLGVFLSKPKAFKAARLSMALAYKCSTNTGVSGAALLISSKVGKRFSAN